MKRRQFIEQIGFLGIASWLETRGSLECSENASSNTELSEKKPAGQAALTVHPDNPKYFLFRGRPLVLLAASEHYGSIVNRRFDFERYLYAATAIKQTVTRTFLLYRELQSARNPCSPLKPDSPDYVAPWPRTGPGDARDGELKYDLDQWNHEYFDRLHRFLSLASRLGIVVELTVFSNTYSDDVWDLNPLREGNNLQTVGTVKWQEYLSQRDGKLFERQVAYARKIVQETSRYDNVYYEVCNEPGGGFPTEPTLAEVDAWQDAMAKVLREELRNLHCPHLLAGQNAFSYKPVFTQAFDASYSETMLDMVNVHPLPNLILKGRQYQLGNFMSKDLKLAEFRDFFLMASQEPKPTVSDEDNAASLYLDDTGWTIDRKRAWMAVMCAAHYNFIDFSIQPHMEAGTEESKRKIRKWMRNLSGFIHDFDFIHASPGQNWILSVPEHVVSAGLAVPGKDYVAYLADGREATELGEGNRISGKISIQLPAGNYRIHFYSPVSGEYSQPHRAKGGGTIEVTLDPFEHDLVLRAVRMRHLDAGRVSGAQPGITASGDK
jgi:hypothetical protein